MGKDLTKVRCTFQFCDGGSCRKAGSEQVIREARAYLKNAGMWDSVHSLKTRCNGRCEDAPTLVVHPGNFWYKNLNPEKSIEVVKSHMLLEEPVKEYLLFQPSWATVKSEKERPMQPSSFKRSNHSTLGDVSTARLSSSDQVLYPLLQFLFSRYSQLEIFLPDRKAFNLQSPPLVDYTHEFDITIRSKELNLRWAIAPIPANISPELQERKIGVAEVVHLKSALSGQKQGIRFANRKGKELLFIGFKDLNGEIWKHILRNYLNLDEAEMQIQLYE